MKKLGLCLLAGIICLSMSSIAGGQQGAGKGKGSTGDLPAAVCQAIEQYVSKIDSARSLKAKAEREERYTEAQNELAAVLQRHEKQALMNQASAYARFTELVASGDPTDAGFDKVLGQRLDSRAALLEMCSSYTISR